MEGTENIVSFLKRYLVLFIYSKNTLLFMYFLNKKCSNSYVLKKTTHIKQFYLRIINWIFMLVTYPGKLMMTT